MVHRIRNVVASGQNGKVPDTLRLLAFDVLRMNATTGRLGTPYYFLVRLPPGEDNLPDNRHAVRQVLTQDLERGGPSSLTMRGLSINIEALRRSGANAIDFFLVSSSFGNTGSAWLVDIAYLCRYFSKGRMPIEVHALLIAPEACQSVFEITAAHRLTNFAVLKELESFQKERDWSKGFSLYGGRYIAGMTGLLTSAPFASVQVIDGEGLSGQPEFSAIPAAADGILCQLDEGTSQILRQARQARLDAARPSQARNLFSTLGVQSLTRPNRLLAELGVQRAILGLVESLLPVNKDPLSERPVGLYPPDVVVTSDPYSNLEHWLGWNETSGVMNDIFYQNGLSLEERQEWVNRLADRDITQWKAALFQVNDSEELVPATGIPESTVPLIQGHFKSFLHALAEKSLHLDENPAGPSEYLAQIEKILTDYMADLGRAEEQLRRQGKHSESTAVRQAVEDTRRDWEAKRASNWSRLFPQQVEEAQERYIEAKQTQVAFQQREALMGSVHRSASLMLTLTRKLIELYRYYAKTLALSRDSLYNTTLDHLQRVNRELETERSIGCQQLVVDENYEERQIHAVFNQLLDRIFQALASMLEGIEKHVDWLGDSIQIHASLKSTNLTDGLIDLAEQNREPEELAGILSRYLGRELGEQMSAALSGNTILNFIGYLNPQPQKLGAELVERSGPLAKTIIPPSVQLSFLFSPVPDATERIPYLRELVYELYQNLTEMYQINSEDPDRIIIFRCFDGLSLDNLVTFLQSVPKPLIPAEFKTLCPVDFIRLLECRSNTDRIIPFEPAYHSPRKSGKLERRAARPEAQKAG